MSKLMKGVKIEENGEKIGIGEYEKVGEELKAGYSLIKVVASAVNRADLSQRYGKYPPPAGESEILGLEISGIIEKISYLEDDNSDKHLNVGDRVCGLLAGGGNAEYCVIYNKLLIPIPSSISFVEAAGLPETFLTAYQTIFYIAQSAELPTSSILIHAAGSGVGIAAIQIARLKFPNITIIATAGADSKLENAKMIGANYVINYKQTNNRFAEQVNEWTNGRGVDVIIDFIGSSYWEENIHSLAVDGRMVILSTLSSPAPISGNTLTLILKKRLTIRGSTLRARDLSYKSKLTSDFVNDFYELWASGKLKVYIDRTFALTEIADAHKHVQSNLNIGKVCLVIDHELASK